MIQKARQSAANLLHWLGDRVGGIDLEAKRENDARAAEVLARISRKAESQLARMSADMEEREKLGLKNVDVPDVWHSIYYFRQGFRASTISQPTPEDHWQGGPPMHDGATCPVCRKPFVLLWDINLKDERISEDGVELFPGLDRLPLYYCPRRPEPTIYQIESPRRIRTIRPGLQAGEESPLKFLPPELPRQPLRLDPIPRDIANLMILAREFECQWLNEEELELLGRFVGVNELSRHDVGCDQFGGVPIMRQGHRAHECPNPACLTLRMGSPDMLLSRRRYEMKELAVIDVGRIYSSWGQVAFHICWKCLTVEAGYRC